MKKTWIKVKRGILEPKHRIQLGGAWFLYFYILDNVNWETGKIIEWHDKAAADELEIPLSTLREYRRRLEEYLYIKSYQKHHRLEIVVNNWTNPREYSGEVYNSFNGDENTEPLENDDGEVNGYNDGVKDGYRDGIENPSPIHLINISHNTDHINSAKNSAEPTYEPCTEDGEPIPEKKKRKKNTDDRSKHPAIVSFRRLTGRYPPKINYDQVIEVLGNEPDELKMKHCYQEWCSRGYKPVNLAWLLDWYVNGISKTPMKKNTGMDAVRAELARLEQEDG